MMSARSVAMASIVSVCLFATSCAVFRHKEEPKQESAAFQPVPVSMTAQDYEAALREVVLEYVKSCNASKDAQRQQVIRRDPYFYREYSVYAEPGADLKIVLQQKESKSSPYIADVTLKKERYATRLHRKRAEALADTNFLRDTGTELITYEWRNARWVRTGSLFVADKSEENINGEWVPVAETSKRTVTAEEPKSEGWLKNLWYTLTGR